MSPMPGPDFTVIISIDCVTRGKTDRMFASQMEGLCSALPGVWLPRMQWRKYFQTGVYNVYTGYTPGPCFKMRSLCSLMQGVWVPRMHGNTRPFILDHPLLSLVYWSIGPPSLLVSTYLHILLLTVNASVKAFPQKVIAKVCVRTPESLYQSHQGSPNVPKIRSPAHH